MCLLRLNNWASHLKSSSSSVMFLKDYFLNILLTFTNLFTVYAANRQRRLSPIVNAKFLNKNLMNSL